MLALKDDLSIPAIIPNIHEEWVTTFTDSKGVSNFFVMSEFIEGESIYTDSRSGYEKLGRLMRQLHMA